MSAILKVLFYLALAIVLVGLAYLNSDQVVTVTYLPAASIADVPVFLVILGSMFLGVLIAGIVGAVEQVRARMRSRELERQIEELEAEVRELRNLPINEGLLHQEESDDRSSPSWDSPE